MAQPGRQRGAAVPGRINEARFLRGFMAVAAAEHFDYNFFQAFDQGGNTPTRA